MFKLYEYKTFMVCDKYKYIIGSHKKATNLYLYRINAFGPHYESLTDKHLRILGNIKRPTVI